MFTNAYKPFIGGVTRSVTTFVEDLRNRGHEVLIVTLQFPGATESTRDVFRLPSLTEFGGTDFSLRLPIPSGLHRRIKVFNPDIVHSHHPFMLGETALRVAKWRNIPIVFTHHTLYEKYTYRFSRDSETLEQVARLMATEYANLCDLVIAPTPGVATIIKERGVTVPVQVIPTGIDLEMFANGDGRRFRQTHHIPDDAFVLGHLGRVVEEKNIDYLGQVVITMLKRHPDAWFVLVGDGEARAGLKERFEQEKIAERVIMTGSLTGSVIADAYQAMDIFIFASKTDTQGIVILESLCSGTPVAALETTGPGDIIEPGESGYLLPPDASPEQFVELLETLKTQPEKLRLCGKKSREKACEFDRDLSAARLYAVYRRLCLARRKKDNGDGDMFWEKIQHKLGTEWELLHEKFAVLAAAINED